VFQLTTPDRPPNDHCFNTYIGGSKILQTFELLFGSKRRATHMWESSTPGEQGAQHPHLFENMLSEIGDGVQSSDILALDEDQCCLATTRTMQLTVGTKNHHTLKGPLSCYVDALIVQLAPNLRLQASRRRCALQPLHARSPQ